jgi:hypothetical protein
MAELKNHAVSSSSTAGFPPCLVPTTNAIRLTRWLIKAEEICVVGEKKKAG